MTRNCETQGHIWVEPAPPNTGGDFMVFNRVRDLADQTPRPVACRYCGKPETMTGYGAKRA